MSNASAALRQLVDWAEQNADPVTGELLIPAELARELIEILRGAAEIGERRQLPH